MKYRPHVKHLAANAAYPEPMKKLYTLKEWFSLDDAAKRLSSGLGEMVSVHDVLQLVIEGHLPLSWYARHVPAERVAKWCYLYYCHPAVTRLDRKPRAYMGPVWWRGEYAFRAHAGMKKDTTPSPYAHLTWTPIHGKQAIQHIEGVYRLELNECGALKDWVHSLLTNTGGELISPDGFFVSDHAGTMWRIMERRPADYRSPIGTVRKLEPFYHPCCEFPDPAELVIERRHIEAFEARIAQNTASESAELNPRERETLLNIIAALLNLLLGRTPSNKPQSVFESQAAVIEALLARHPGKSGIAKRTLEEKLTQAKRSLASP